MLRYQVMSCPTLPYLTLPYLLQNYPSEKIRPDNTLLYFTLQYHLRRGVTLLYFIIVTTLKYRMNPILYFTLSIF